MDRKQLLKDLVTNRFDGKQADFARAINRSPAQVNQWLSGHRAIGDAGARHIELKLSLPQGYFDGRKPLSDALSTSSTQDLTNKHPGNTHGLINLSAHPDLCPIKRVQFKLAAGVHGYALEVDNGDAAPVFFRKDWIKSNGYSADKLVAFRVKGQSMEPSLWDGDLVVVNLADNTPHDGEVFAVSYEGEPGIKRVRRDAGEWWLASDNTDQRKFAPKRCTEDVEILGRVIYKQSERI